MSIRVWRLIELSATVVGVIVASAIVLAMGGCTGMTLQPDYAQMSQAQIKALTADKSVGVWCGSIGSYGKAVYVSADVVTGAAARNARGLTVDGSTCNVTITETPPLPAKP